MALPAGTRVRQKDIARDANVSVMTVSKVVRGCADVAPATRRRILARIKELNYRPHWVARSLVAGRTFTIGLVVPDLAYSFFAEIGKSIANTIRPLGYELILSVSGEDPAVEGEGLDRLIERQVDGIILAPAAATPLRELIRRLQKTNIPLVLIDRQDPEGRAGFVGVDDRAIGRLAATHLIECGSRRVAHIFGPGLGSAMRRREGYLEALSTHGLSAPENYLTGAVDERSGYEAARRLLALDPRPDAIFAFNDPIAAGAIRAVLEAGFRIPEDVKVVGAGNLPFSELLRVPLSTIDPGSVAVGERAAEMLVETIGSSKGRRARIVELEPALIVRESTVQRAG